jgi:type VI secretion system protein ImpE
MLEEYASYLDAGDLASAIDSLNAEVRAHPADLSRRSSLAALLCFDGQLERADRVLDVIAEQEPGLAVGVALLRQLVCAEQARTEFYTNCRLPSFLQAPDASDQQYLRAFVEARAGNVAAARRLLDEAEQARAPLSGTMAGQRFSDFRDLDDICAAHFDVLTSTGKFFWIPMKAVRRLRLHPPRRRLDYLWRRATMEVETGPSGDVYLAAIYSPGSTVAAHLRLGQQTDFQGGTTEPVRGRGLRMFLVGEDAKTVHELADIVFDPPA